MAGITADCGYLASVFPSVFFAGVNCCNGSNKYVKCTASFNGGVPRVTTLILQNVGLGEVSLTSDICGLRFIQYISLVNIGVTGTIPTCLAKLASLSQLDLTGNSITEPIDLIGNMTSLTFLKLSQNAIKQRIPASFSRLSNIQTIELDNNQFYGPIPQWIGTLSTLSVLDLSDNTLTGNIPPQILGIPNLQTLKLGNNALSGEIPNNFTQAYDLIVLNLMNNALSGPIPQSIGKCGNLYDLNLSGNHLSGKIPSVLGTIPALEHLDLSNNDFTGEIPTQLCKILGLQTVILNDNYLSGQIPFEFGSLSGLERLNLSGNCMSLNPNLYMSTHISFGAQRDSSSCVCPLSVTAPTNAPANSSLLFTDSNCGTCGNICPLSNPCDPTYGSCSCPFSVNTNGTGTGGGVLNDPNNCGGCGIQCGQYEVCRGGFCSCAYTACPAGLGQTCVNFICSGGRAKITAGGTGGNANFPNNAFSVTRDWGRVAVAVLTLSLL